jgi:hypothetical protein
MLAADLSAQSVRRSLAREITIPAGTVLRVRLANTVGSDLSRIEDPVSGSLIQSVVMDGRTVLPAGTRATGIVTDAQRSGRVKGRARIAVQFNRLTETDGDRHAIRTRNWVAVAPATKKRDALMIAAPAGGGALIGGLTTGKTGAGIGALIGGGAGTGVVLATRGKEVRLGRGRVLAVRLASPVTVLVE